MTGTELAGVPLRDVQEAASRSDPRTTMRCHRARASLDRHATCIVATCIASAAALRWLARLGPPVDGFCPDGGHCVQCAVVVERHVLLAALTQPDVAEVLEHG